MRLGSLFPTIKLFKFAWFQFCFCSSLMIAQPTSQFKYVESETSLFEPLFKLGADLKPASLEKNQGYKVIVPDEIWTVENLFSKEEAESMIESSEKAGFVDAEYISEKGESNYESQYSQ